jgi:hypothetical protein
MFRLDHCESLNSPSTGHSSTLFDRQVLCLEWTGRKERMDKSHNTHKLRTSFSQSGPWSMDKVGELLPSVLGFPCADTSAALPQHTCRQGPPRGTQPQWCLPETTSQAPPRTVKQSGRFNSRLFRTTDYSHCHVDLRAKKSMDATYKLGTRCHCHLASTRLYKSSVSLAMSS